MGVAAAMALVCFVSSNPSPQHWLVSGQVEAVARMDDLVGTMAEVRRIAHAVDGDTAFSRYEMGANPPNRVMLRLITSANRDLLVISRFQHIIPSCPGGERSQIGDSRSELVMGLIGPAAINRLDARFRARSRQVRLEDGRTGIGVALKEGSLEYYDPLLRQAAEGKLGGVDLVLMRPKE